MSSGEQKRSPQVDLPEEDPVRRTARVSVGQRSARGGGELRERTRALPAGSLIADRYEVIRLLGAGGMGAVYEANQLAIGRRVAVKVLRAEVEGDPFIAQRFQREARAAASIHHPNIVVVHDFGTCDDGTLFLAMELLEGPSLLQKLRGTGNAGRELALPAREAVRIATEIASALDAAHAAGIVHRDLKPDNVMLPTQGGVKVLDFGIARFMEQEDDAANQTQFGDRAQLTDAMQVLGTPRYISPEAVSRQRVGPSADLYALGAILFEMLAGRPVFVGNEPVILMANHLKEKPPLLREVIADSTAPIALEVLVNDLLKKTPAERPTSAAEVRQRLQTLDWQGATIQSASKRRPSLGPPPGPSRTPPPSPTMRGPGTGTTPLLGAMGALPPLPPLTATPAPLAVVPPPPPPRVQPTAPAPLPPLHTTPAPAKQVVQPISALAPPPPTLVPNSIFSPEEFSLAALPQGVAHTKEATFQAPPTSPSKGRSRKGPSVIAILITLILAGSVGTMLMRHRQLLEELHIREEMAARVEAAPIQNIDIQIITHTPRARISWDGVAVDNATFQVPRDGRTHTLTVRAQGYTPHSEDIVADGPQTRTIELSRGRQ